MKSNQGTNSSEMRSSNELLILNLLRRQSCSRAQIAKLTGLSRAGVTILVDSLIRRGFVRETVEGGKGIGRKAMGLSICADAGYIIGIHLRRKDCKIGVFDFLGELLYYQELTYDKNLVPATQLISTGKAVLSMLGGTWCGWSKGARGWGMHKRSGGRGGWKGHPPLLQMARDRDCARSGSVLPWPCHLTNRSTARTMYEKFNGLCRDYSDFIFLKVDEAVGGGVVSGGRLLTATISLETSLAI